MPSPRILSVIGPSRPSPEVAHDAYLLGRFLGQHRAIVVTGGLGGVMEAVSRGLRETGGLAVGLLPGDSPADANPYVHVPLATGLGHFRNYLVVSAGQLVIAVGESRGTLSEATMALTLGKPVWALHWHTPLQGLQSFPDLSTLQEALHAWWNSQGVPSR